MNDIDRQTLLSTAFRDAETIVAGHSMRPLSLASRAVINDPLAIALAVDPSLGSADPFPLQVDLSDGPLRGRTTIGSREGDDPMVKVFRRFDIGRVHGLLLEHVFGRWLTPADFAA